MTAYQKIAKILGVTEKTLIDFEGEISLSTGKNGVIEKIAADNDKIINKTLEQLNIGVNHGSEVIQGALQKAIFYHEKQFLDFLKTMPGKNEFEEAAGLSRILAKVKPRFFLKKDLIRDIFKKRTPENLLRYLNYGSVGELLEKEINLTESFSALRFVESDEWMHKTFEDAYSNFTAADFEERDIEIRVLSDKWHGIAKKFVEKKHHNVSHLKEFGVIFLNPIKMDIPGKFLRDFALLLHYFHEIEFYARLFKKYASASDFAERFKSLLRGDVKELMDVKDKNTWLIVQRYLVKDNPQDPRLFQPRVNPESMHWAKGEKDLARIGESTNNKVDLSMWFNLDWVGGIFMDGSDPSISLGAGEIVSFDLEDNAMSLVSAMEGQHQHFSYHQREAMWTKIFAEYAGGEEKLEQMIADNFDKGFITL